MLARTLPVPSIAASYRQEQRGQWQRVDFYATYRVLGSRHHECNKTIFPLYLPALLVCSQLGRSQSLLHCVLFVIPLLLLVPRSQSQVLFAQSDRSLRCDSSIDQRWCQRNLMATAFGSKRRQRNLTVHSVESAWVMGMQRQSE